METKNKTKSGGGPPSKRSQRRGRTEGYPVKFKDSTLGEYLCPKTDYVLIIVGAEYITVSTDDPKERGKRELSWLLATIKKYSSRPVDGNPSLRLLMIETGRQSSTGRGVFHFLTQHGDQIAEEIRETTNRSYQASVSLTSDSLSSSQTMSTPVLRSCLHYSRYIDVFTLQEEVEKFKEEMKATRPNVDRGETFPEGNPSDYIVVLPDDVEPSDLARDGGGSSRDGDITPRDPPLDDATLNWAERMSKNDESECFEEDGECNTTVAMENQDLGNFGEDATTNNWDSTEDNHVDTLEGLGEDSANTKSVSGGRRSVQNSRKSRKLHSDEVVSDGEEHRRRTSSNTRPVSSNSGDSDGDATNPSRPRDGESKTMPDILQSDKCTSRLLQDILHRIKEPREFCPVVNYHPVLSSTPSVFSETSVINQLQNPTKVSFPTVETRHSTSEVKYVCGDCGWHKKSKGWKRSVMRKDKKCERCNKVIKSPKSPKKEQGQSILNRLKEKLHRSSSSTLDNIYMEPLPHDRPSPPLVKQLKNIENHVLVPNPALGSARGQRGIAPSAAHTAHALRIGGDDVRAPPRTSSCGDESPTSPKGAISSSRSEGNLGSTSLTPSEQLPRASGEKNKVLVTKTKSTPVFLG